MSDLAGESGCAMQHPPTPDDNPLGAALRELEAAIGAAQGVSATTQNLSSQNPQAPVSSKLATPTPTQDRSRPESDQPMNNAPPADGERRGPGRPSKAPRHDQFRSDGISIQPVYPDDTLELGHSDPNAWKKVIHFFGKMKVEEIHLQATPKGLYLYTSDCSNRLRVCVYVDGSKVNHYYCRDEVWLSLNPAHVIPIFEHISKSCDLLQLRCSESSPGELVITLVDNSVDKANNFPVTVSYPRPRPEWMNIRELYSKRKDYRVQWTVPQSVFRKSHEIAKCTSPTITVQVKNNILTLRYIGSGIDAYSEEYRTGAKIDLKTKLTHGETFIIDYSVADGKNLSTASPADMVTVYCTEGASILAVFDEKVSDSAIQVVTAMSPYT